MSHVRCPNCGITVASRGVSVPVCLRCIRRGQGRHLMTLVPAPHLMRKAPPPSPVRPEATPAGP